MEEKNILYDKLVEQLMYSEDIFKKASNKVHDEAMTNKFESLAKQRNFYKNEVKKLLDVERDKLKPSQALKATLDKAWIDINHFYLRLNEGETLDVVIKAEEELIKLYEHLIIEIEDHPMVANVLRIQLSDFHSVIDDLKSIRSEYKFS